MGKKYCFGGIFAAGAITASLLFFYIVHSKKTALLTEDELRAFGVIPN